MTVSNYFVSIFILLQIVLILVIILVIYTCCRGIIYIPDRRLWRKLQCSKDGKETISFMTQPIAVNSISEEECQRITGHFKRRTAICAMAKAGMTCPQIRAATGHHSDNVVQ